MSADTPVPSKTPVLYDAHAALGARFTDFAGWSMPLRYDSDVAEHHAVRSSAGIFDLSHMGQIRVAGPQAAAALDHALVGTLSAVTVGRAKYSLLANETGGVIDDLVVYRLGDDDFLVVANASNVAPVLAALTERAAGFDASVTDESDDTVLVAVQGPASEAILVEAAPDDAEAVRSLKYYAAVPVTVAGVPALLARTGYTGEDGFEVYVPAADARTVWDGLLALTTEHGGVPAGLAARDTLRLEAGMPLYGHELDAQTSPYEAGLGRVVRLEKEFVGRDALAAVAEAPARRLVGLVGEGRRAAREGSAVLDASGAVIGTVTSGVLSPTLGHPIALAFVDAAHADDEGFDVDVRGKVAPYRTVALPFYRRG